MPTIDLGKVVGEDGKSGDSIPVGSIILYSGEIIPDGFLICDGSILEQEDYPELFAVIGTTYGYYSRTDFKLPDFRDKVPVGKDSTDTDFNELGKTGGEKTHTLTVDEMPSHTHNALTKANWTTSSSTWAELARASATSGDIEEKDGYISSKGGGQPHNNLQPYIVTNYIIKAKKTATTDGEIIQEDGTASTTNVYSASAIDNKLKTNIVTGQEVATNEYIDGKQVFVKRVEFTFPTTINAWTTLIQLDSTVDDLIDKKLRYYSGRENYDFPYNFENEEIICYFNKNNKTLNVKTNFSYPGGKPGWGILKYTKN